MLRTKNWTPPTHPPGRPHPPVPATGDPIIRPIFDGHIKRSNCSFEQYHLFPQSFQKAFFFNVLKWVYMEERVKLLFFKLQTGLSGFEQLNCFPNKPWFLHVCSTSLLKTLQEKEQLLVTSNFSFSHSVFYPFEELSSILINFEIVICKVFQFGRV